MARIAWIEDDHPEIGDLVRLLELDEHDILRYRTYPEVEEQIETVCACDAIILDIILPPITDDPYRGLSLLKKIREEHEYRDPVVVCSVVTNPTVLRQLRDEFGVVDILRKPARPSVLYDTVTKALEEVTPNEGE